MSYDERLDVLPLNTYMPLERAGKVAPGHFSGKGRDEVIAELAPVRGLGPKRIVDVLVALGLTDGSEPEITRLYWRTLRQWAKRERPWIG